MISVNYSTAREVIIDCLKTNLVPMIHGSPGCGKSSLVHEIAKEYKLRILDIRLSQVEPTELLGFPQIKGDRASYVPMDIFPLNGDPVPEGYKGFIIFLDEFNSALPAVQRASYKFVLDRMVGKYHLHPKARIVCAGNLDTDNALTEEMSTAMQSRLVHLKMVSQHLEWVAWASANKINHKAISFINFKPSALYDFKSDHVDCTYSCNRTWHMASDFLNLWGDTLPERALATLSGTLGEGVARDFLSFCAVYKDLPSLDEILKSPTTTKIPDEPGTMYALTGLVSEHCNKSNIDTMHKYLFRFPLEFQTVALRSMLKKDKDLINTAPVRDWIKVNSKELF